MRKNKGGVQKAEINTAVNVAANLTGVILTKDWRGKMDYQKIYEALRMIKEVCGSYNSNTDIDCCEKCPLGRANGTCCVTGKVPECWNLRKLDPVIRLME